MRRLTAIWCTCSVLLIGSFGVLLLVDRRAGIALPYSVPLAFAVTLLAASALFMAGEALLARRPVRAIAPAAPAAAPRIVKSTPRTAPEGVVLLDLSSLVAFSGQRT
jgi:hypothetical protein